MNIKFINDSNSCILIDLVDLDEKIEIEPKSCLASKALSLKRTTTAELINVKSISYNDIQLCKKSDKHSINGVNSDNIVEITTANQTYYIPIKNPYDFINELYKKLNTCNR